MRILGIDSSGLVASVAIVADDIMQAEYTVNYKKTHSQTLLPMLDEIVKMIELDISEIDAIAVAAGPGSFTGLRIGASTAKGLGLALDKPLVSVPTMEGLAYNMYGTDKVICPLMDARRNQVYTGIYEFCGNDLQVITAQEAVSIEDILTHINGLKRDVIFLGDGAGVYEDVIRSVTDVPFYFAPPHLSRQRAGSVAALGAVYYKEGRYESAASHKPVYLRLSQAERERREREQTEDVL